MQHFVYCVGVACLLLNSHGLAAEPPDTNYDESKVPAYELPKLLVDAAGRPVENREQWLGGRRMEVLRLFEEAVYGRTPSQKLPVRYEVTEVDKLALGGLATRKQIFGKNNLADANFPEPDQPLHTTVGYHLRSGDHDVTAYDWQQYLQFADRHLR